MLIWETSGSWWFLASLIPIALFYFLRLRFRRQPVSSVYLWSRLLQHNQGGTRLKTRSILLLLLQILAALAAVASVAVPVWMERDLALPGTIYLIDVSGSMGAVEAVSGQKRTRLEEALRKAGDEIRKKPRESYGMIFLCAGDAIPIGSPSKNIRQLLHRLDGIKTGYGGFSEVKVTTRLQAWKQTQLRPWKVCLFSDGGLDLKGEEMSRIFGADFQVITVGKESRNVGVGNLRLSNDSTGIDARFFLYNGSAASETVRISLFQRQTEDRMINLASSILSAPVGLSEQSIRWGDGKETDGIMPGVYRLEVNFDGDGLKLDNRFDLAINPPSSFRVLVVGPPDPFLRAVLNHPEIQTVMASDFTRYNPNDDWDLIIADTVTVPAKVNNDFLSLGALPEILGAKPGPIVSGSPVSSETEHPLLRFVDWEGVEMAGQALPITPETAPGFQVLATIGETPVLAAWEDPTKKQRGVLFATDLFRSNLGLSGAFPVFMRNMWQWCFPQFNNPLAYTLTTGIPAVLAVGSKWRLPDSQGISVERKGQRIVLTSGLPGVWRWEDEKSEGWVTVNPPASEMEISPRTIVTAPTGAGVETAPFVSFRYPLFTWSLLLLVICLVIEWLIWHGRRQAGKE